MALSLYQAVGQEAGQRVHEVQAMQHIVHPAIVMQATAWKMPRRKEKRAHRWDHQSVGSSEQVSHHLGGDTFEGGGSTWTFRLMAEREMLALSCLWVRSDRVAARERIDEHIKSCNIAARSIAVRALPHTTWSTEELHSFEN